MMETTASNSQPGEEAGKNTVFPDRTHPLNPPVSPKHIVLITIVGVALAEVVAMLVIAQLPSVSYAQATFLDALIMVALILPLVYYLIFRSLIKYIAGREQAEQALKQSEALLQKVLENLPVGVWITDRKGQIVHGNPASQKIWAGAKYVGIEQYGTYKGWWLKNGEPIAPEDWAAARAVTRGETSLDEEVEIECFDGTHKIILNAAVPILDEHNAIQGAIIVNQDITQRKQAEQELVRTNELLERYFSSIHTLIAYMDRDFNFVRVNETYARSAGHPTEYFNGKNHFALYPHAENQAIFQQVVETGEPFIVFEKPFEYPEYPERGVTYWDWSVQPVKGLDGVVQGVVLSLVDVTERKQFELQLARQNQELRSLSEAERRQRQVAESLSAAARALTQTLDLDHVINILLEHIDTIIHPDTCGVALLEGETRLAIRAVRGYERWDDPQEILSIVVDIDESPLLQAMVSNRKSLLIPDTAAAPDWKLLPRLEPIRSLLAVPLVAGDKFIGLAGLGKTEAGHFSDEQIQWAEALVGQAAMAIQNAWLFEQVRASSERLQGLSHRLVEVQENERRYIASELHDEAGQALITLMVGLQLIEKNAEQPDVVRAEVTSMGHVLEAVTEDLHRLAMDLRPVSLDHLGLEAALRQHVLMMSEKLGVEIQFAMTGIGERLPANIEIAFYRIVQEALNNVARHAHATHVDVLITQRAGCLALIVEDDGTGFVPDEASKGKRLGLDGMRERAEMLDGKLVIESIPGKGSTLLVEVPYARPNSHRR